MAGVNLTILKKQHIPLCNGLYISYGTTICGTTIVLNPYLQCFVSYNHKNAN